LDEIRNAQSDSGLQARPLGNRKIFTIHPLPEKLLTLSLADEELLKHIRRSFRLMRQIG